MGLEQSIPSANATTGVPSPYWQPHPGPLDIQSQMATGLLPERPVVAKSGPFVPLRRAEAAPIYRIATQEREIDPCVAGRDGIVGFSVQYSS